MLKLIGVGFYLFFFLKVEAAMLTRSNSTQVKNDIQRRLALLADRKLGPEDKEIKLCYVTVCAAIIWLCRFI